MRQPAAPTVLAGGGEYLTGFFFTKVTRFYAALNSGRACHCYDQRVAVFAIRDSSIAVFHHLHSQQSRGFIMITSSASSHSNTPNTNIYQPIKNAASKVGSDISSAASATVDAVKSAATAVQE